jgi:phage gp36-like protein
MYATPTDLLNRLDLRHLVELADDDGDGQPDTAVLEACIADADSVIDSCLRARYLVPLSPVPPLLRKLSADLAIANLFARRREAVSPAHQQRALAARDLLQSLATGEIQLADAGPLTSNALPKSTSLDRSRAFAPEALDSF